MKTTQHLLLFLLLVLVHTILPAQETGYQKKRYLQDGDTLPYRLLLPKNYDASRSYPLILFLHGSGERGNDNDFH